MLKFNKGSEQWVVGNVDFRLYFFCKEKERKSMFDLRSYWYSRRESNPQRPLRRGLLYPFNYESILFWYKQGLY